MKNSKPISQEEFEKFESYILGNMEAHEKAEFEKILASDKAFAQKLEEIKVILEGVEEAAFRKNLDRIYQELEAKSPDSNETRKSVDKEKTIKLSPWNFIFIAASLFLAIGVVVWLFLFQSDPSERLFMSYYKADPGLLTAMSSAISYEFDRGMVDYKSANYQEAINRWEKLIEDKPESDTLQFFLGSSYLALKKTDPAIFYFDAVISNENSSFQKDAIWYLGLTYVLEGKKDKAIETLSKSENPNATELLKKIREP
ncbi:MAG: hypothetical protein HLUCCX10_14450 [Algoriphagus marincola HL-49]|uniref:Uncharacterized protein n=1 Tax=Algoriphagus marincola HL-49 TaxID=1305737 RepID=A0A0P7Y658_9BACT|nr:MAG: hypothetical protein HLUCCX10_14450 [Algoriphagus marincola HL-49]